MFWRRSIETAAPCCFLQRAAVGQVHHLGRHTQLHAMVRAAASLLFLLTLTSYVGAFPSTAVVHNHARVLTMPR